MEEDTVQAQVPLEKLTRVYIKMRDKKAELTQQLEAEIAKVEASMKTVKTAILDHMKAIGAESLRTEADRKSTRLNSSHT